MDEIVGAWSISDRLPHQVLSVAQRQALRLAVRADSEYVEATEGQLWLWAPKPKIKKNSEHLVAGVGFFAGTGIAGALDPEALLEGHFSLLRHQRRDKTLTLYRSLSGGERLYFAQPTPGLVVFATTIWPLLSLQQPALQTKVLDEVLLTGLTMFGTETLHAGIHEVMPGHALTLTAQDIGQQRLVNSELLVAPRGAPEALAREFRDKLTNSVAACAGPTRPVVVALSGGIDSSAIAAAAVEAFGANAVHAITYEFDDPGHSVETQYAKMVADKLGIVRHHIFALKTEEYHAAIPEMIYRSESLVHWPKSFMLLVAREVKRLGYDRYLTGFGIGSHLSYLSELGKVLPKAASLVTSHWKSARFSHRRWPDRVARLHPSLELPHPRLYYLLVQLLAQRGYVRDISSFFPPELHPLIHEAPADPLDNDDMPLGQWLQHKALARGVGCIDVTRSEKPSRELGVYRISPAHFDSCIPYAHFPIEPTPRLYSEARSLRPGKQLLRLAYQGILPDEVLYRVKSWGDAVASDCWLRTGRRMMLSVLPGFPHDFGEYGAHYPKTIQGWEPKSILATSLALRMWMRIFLELPAPAEPPTWHELWQTLSTERAA